MQHVVSKLIAVSRPIHMHGRLYEHVKCTCVSLFSMMGKSHLEIRTTIYNQLQGILLDSALISVWIYAMSHGSCALLLAWCCMESPPRRDVRGSTATGSALERSSCDETPGNSTKYKHVQTQGPSGSPIARSQQIHCGCSSWSSLASSCHVAWRMHSSSSWCSCWCQRVGIFLFGIVCHCAKKGMEFIEIVASTLLLLISVSLKTPKEPLLYQPGGTTILVELLVLSAFNSRNRILFHMQFRCPRWACFRRPLGRSEGLKLRAWLAQLAHCVGTCQMIIKWSSNVMWNMPLSSITCTILVIFLISNMFM